MQEVQQSVHEEDEIWSWRIQGAGVNIWEKKIKKSKLPVDCHEWAIFPVCISYQYLVLLFFMDLYILDAIIITTTINTEQHKLITVRVNISKSTGKNVYFK